MEISIKIVCFLLIILSIVININAQTGPFYVATNGNDGDDGSFLTPFKTIQKAADVMSTNVTVASCYIFPGTYNGKTVNGLYILNLSWIPIEDSPALPSSYEIEQDQ